MRFKKGSKVEVLSKKEVPSGVWRCAEIICGNGHNYTVKFDGYAGAADESAMERVSRKAIRPCPPPLDVSENWVPGDIVEMFDYFSWKMAMVSTALGKKHYLVRQLGSSQVFQVSKFDLRVRQSWQKDKWVLIGKGSGNCEDGKRNENLPKKYNQLLISQVQQTTTRINLCVKDDCFPVKNNVNIQESHIVSSKTLKRGSPYCYSQAEAYAGVSQKFRAIEKEGRCSRIVAANPSSFPERVDAVASPREMLVAKYIHDSFNNRSTEYSQMDAERRKQTGAVGCSLVMNLEANDDDNDSIRCSVGSCSITSNESDMLPRHFPAVPIDDIDGNISDAESFCWGYEEGNSLLPTKEELVAEIHRLELHAYRCTIEALHASGPLSWEKEALVTNLRLSLHISNDEHLMELRNLVSADS